MSDFLINATRSRLQESRLQALSMTMESCVHINGDLIDVSTSNNKSNNKSNNNKNKNNNKSISIRSVTSSSSSWSSIRTSSSCPHGYAKDELAPSAPSPATTTTTTTTTTTRSRYWIQVPPMEIDVLEFMNEQTGFRSDHSEQLKEWIWNQCRDQIRASLQVTTASSAAAAAASSSSTTSLINAGTIPPTLPPQTDPVDGDDDDDDDSLTAPARIVPSSIIAAPTNDQIEHTTIMSGETVPPKQDEWRDASVHDPPPTRAELEKYKKRLYLLDKVAQVQQQYLQSEGPKVVYGHMLDGLLDLMQSEYGLVGEVKYEEDGTMYLQTHASTNIAWDDASMRHYYRDAAGLKFYNMNSLLGLVLTTKRPVISNEPRTDPRSGGLPEGHPPVNQFLGIPFFKKDGEIIGMLGIANKLGGYTEADVEFLEPFIATGSNLIQAYWQIQNNKYLINNLEQKVRARTLKLQRANERLEQANRQVINASAAQLQHFACMSHEIRTPLNCIIGLSSLVMETNLSRMQEESLQMIVNSGDLLLTVVNDVLDYSKLESGNVEIEVRKSSLQETLNSVVHSIEMKAQAKNCKVETYYDPNLPEHLTTDCRRLLQVLYNLLGNAIKFSNEGGVIDLSVSICSERCKAYCFDPSEKRSVCPVPSMKSLVGKIESSSITSDDDFDDEFDSPRQQHSNDPLSTISSLNMIDRQLSDCVIVAPTFSLPPSGLSASRCPLSRPEHLSLRPSPASSAAAGEGTSVSANPMMPESICPLEGKHSVPSRSFVAVPMADNSEAVSLSSTMNGSRCPLARCQTKIVSGVGPMPSDPSIDRATKTSDACSKVFMSKSQILIPQQPAMLPEQWVRFAVKDYGKGISSTDYEHIFQPFRQASAETERVYGGTGLGLAITAKLVSALGGTICVDSKEGEWTEFIVDLPFQDDKVDASMISSKLKDTTVCLVDTDEKQIQIVAQIMDHFQVDLMTLSSMCEMETAIQQRDGSENRTYILLVQEDLYISSAFPRLTETTNIVLLSFGPTYKVVDTCGHFRSLTHVLPSVLLELISVCVADASPRTGSNMGGGLTKRLSCEWKPNLVPYHTLRVLVAEDNLINQKVMLRMLKRMGIKQVDVVNNGRAAVKAEASKLYDIILMDMQMPEMDGIAACRCIIGRYTNARSHLHQSRPKIIFVTAHVSTSYENECIQAGASGFLSKPFNTREIDRCFQKVIATRDESLLSTDDLEPDHVSTSGSSSEPISAAIEF